MKIWIDPRSDNSGSVFRCLAGKVAAKTGFRNKVLKAGGQFTNEKVV